MKFVQIRKNILHAGVAVALVAGMATTLLVVDLLPRRTHLLMAKTTVMALVSIMLVYT